MTLSGPRAALVAARMAARAAAAVEKLPDFTVQKSGGAETFEAGADYNHDAPHGWTRAGLDKLIKLHLWKREFSRGSFGSADAQIKTQPPSLDQVRALAVASQAVAATTAMRSIVPAASPEATSAAPAKPAAAAAYSPDQVAAKMNAETNRQLGR